MLHRLADVAGTASRRFPVVVPTERLSPRSTQDESARLRIVCGKLAALAGESFGVGLRLLRRRSAVPPIPRSPVWPRLRDSRRAASGLMHEEDKVAGDISKRIARFAEPFRVSDPPGRRPSRESE